jgi:hypothetical protein
MITMRGRTGANVRTGGDEDALLQASRRVDWRFLLPDPDMGHVALLGPPRGSLVESLRLFSTSVTIIGRSNAESLDACQYDVVVAIRPSYDEIANAASLVRENGFLYVEANGLRGPEWKRRLVGRWMHRKTFRLLWPSDYTGFVESLGFDEVQSHWHWPNFDSCTTMIPLTDRAALLHVLNRQQRDRGERLRAMVARCLVRAGILTRLVPCFSVVARRVL